MGEDEYMVHISSSAYLSSYKYHQPRPESQKSQNLPKWTLGSHDRRLWAPRSNPILGPSATNLVCTWEKGNIYFISVVRHTCGVIDITSSSQNLKNLENLPRSRPPGTKPFTWGTSTSPNLGPSATNLGFTLEKGNIWSISVVSHTCRVIYITSLAQNIKISKICSDRDLREAKPSPLSDEMCQISATDALESRWAPRIRLRKINVIVVGHIYQFIYVTSSAKNVKKLQNLPSSFKQHLKPLSNS